MAHTVADVIRWAAQRLDAADVFFGHGTDNARDEAAWLVGGALRLSPMELDAALTRKLSGAERMRVGDLIDARIATRKPAAYLLNEAWFAGECFYVDERVIVPRSHIGEFVRERLQPWIAPTRVRRVLDLCTGSGCIAIAAARAFPDAQIDASDISADALAVARINIERHQLTGRVRLVESDLFAALAGTRYDVILTNPPYVAANEMATLPAEYRHEPTLALVSGARGLDAITRILAHAHAHLEPGGILLAETGNSCAALQKCFADVPFLWLTTATGDESVFLLTAEQIATYRARFARG